MATALATMPKQHDAERKALAVSMFASGATSKEVEMHTGISASYVRTLARRVSQKSVAPVAETVAPETAFQETTATPAPPRRNTEQAPVATPKSKRDYVVVFGASVLFCIALGHAALIWYDCSILWGVPGKIAGGIVFLVILAAVSLMGRPQAKEASENMLWFVWMLDGLAAFVHYPTFWHSSTVGYQFGIREFETWAMSAVVCVCSAAAVYFYNQIVIK